MVKYSKKSQSFTNGFVINLGNLAEVESLIKNVADVKKLVNSKDDSGSTALHHVARHGRSL